MNLLAPVLMVLAVAIPITLVGWGVRLRTISIASAILLVVGVVLLKTGLDTASLEMRSMDDPGPKGVAGIFCIISALVAGITTAIIGIVHVMSNTSKGK